jgi:MtaA/CmuA family methyltransferase
MTGRERVEAVIGGRDAGCLPFMPITMMFAADQFGVPYGRYATDYRSLVDAQMQTAEKFDFDYVSSISDPAREAADCGAAVHYFDDQPPAIDEQHALLADTRTLLTLTAPDPFGGGRMHDRVQATALFRERVGQEKVIEGWVEGPCAEAADLRGINTLMMDFYEKPQFVRDLFEFVIAMEIAFAQAQVDAGATLIGIGDAAASLVGPDIYNEFVWPYELRLVQAVQAMDVPVRLHICGNIRPILEAIGRLHCEIVDLDFMVPVAEARAAMGPDQVLLGNVEPVGVLRNGTPDDVNRVIAQCHAEAGARYIVGAGCEVPRDTPEVNVLAMRAYARGDR